MEPALNQESKAIIFDKQKFHAAQCDQCGAKMYPPRLLQPHLSRHRRRHEWFTTELKKLQDTFARMRDLN